MATFTEKLKEVLKKLNSNTTATTNADNNITTGGAVYKGSEPTAKKASNVKTDFTTTDNKTYTQTTTKKEEGKTFVPETKITYQPDLISKLNSDEFKKATTAASDESNKKASEVLNKVKGAINTVDSYAKSFIKGYNQGREQSWSRQLINDIKDKKADKVIEEDKKIYEELTDEDKANIKVGDDGNIIYHTEEINDLKNKLNTYKSVSGTLGGGEDQILDLENRIAYLEDLDKKSKAVEELGNYEALQESGDTNAFETYRETLSHKNDNILERGINAGSHLVATTINEIPTLVDETVMAGNANVANQNLDELENMYNEGKITADEYAESLAYWNEFVNDYKEAYNDSVSQQIQTHIDQLSVNTYYGASDIEKFALQAGESTAQFMLHFAIGKAVSSSIFTQEQTFNAGVDALREAGEDIAKDITMSNASPELLKTIMNVGNRTLGGGVATVSMSLQSTADKTNQLIQEGVDVETAVKNGIFTGLVSYATEKVGMDNFVDMLGTKVSKEIMGTIIAKDFKNALSEGLEEVVEGLVDPLIDAATLGTDYEVNGEELLMEFLLGGTSGLVMSVGANASNALSQYSNINNILKQSSALRGQVNAKIGQLLVNSRDQYHALEKEINILKDNYSTMTDKQKSVADELIVKGEKALLDYANRSKTLGVTFADELGEEIIDTDKEVYKAVEIDFNDEVQRTKKIDDILNNIDGKINQLGNDIGNLLDETHKALSESNYDISARTYLSLDEKAKKDSLVALDFSKATGLPVEIVNDLPTKVNGYFEDGKVVIDGTKKPILSTLAHELTHGTESSKYYENLAKLVSDRFGDEKTVENEINRIKDSYNNFLKRNNKTLLDFEGAKKEFVAKQIETLLNDETFINDLVKYNTSTASKIYQDLIAMDSNDETKKIKNMFEKAFTDAKLEMLEDGTVYSVDDYYNIIDDIVKNPKTYTSSIDLADGRYIGVKMLGENPTWFGKGRVHGWDGHQTVISPSALADFFTATAGHTYKVGTADVSFLKGLLTTINEPIAVVDETEEGGPKRYGAFLNGHATSVGKYAPMYAIVEPYQGGILTKYNETKDGEYQQHITKANTVVSLYPIDKLVGKDGLIKNSTLSDFFKKTGSGILYSSLIGKGVSTKEEYQTVRDAIKSLTNNHPKFSIDTEAEMPSGEVSNDGTELSVGQVEYNKDSKLRDDLGRLLKLFHTSKNLFYEFDPRETKFYKFGKNIVNYFSSNKAVSGSYSEGNYEETRREGNDKNSEIGKLKEELAKIKENRDEASKKVDDEKNKLYETLKDKEERSKLRTTSSKLFEYNKYLFWQNPSGDILLKSFDVLDSLLGNIADDYIYDTSYGEEYSKEIFDRKIANLGYIYGYNSEELLNKYLNDAVDKNYLSKNDVDVILSFKEMANDLVKLRDSERLVSDAKQNISELSKRGYQYGGFGNSKNPYIINGENRYNDDFPINWSNIEKSIDFDTNKIKDLWVNVVAINNDNVFNKKNSKYKTDIEILKNSTDVDYLVNNPMALAYLTNKVIDDTNFTGVSVDTSIATNDVVKAVLAVNEFLGETKYDGVWFKGITDSGSGTAGSDAPSDIIALFDSNQFKLADNLNPTESKDIRYSIDTNDVDFEEQTNPNEDTFTLDWNTMTTKPSKGGFGVNKETRKLTDSIIKKISEKVKEVGKTDFRYTMLDEKTLQDIEKLNNEVNSWGSSVNKGEMPSAERLAIEEPIIKSYISEITKGKTTSDNPKASIIIGPPASGKSSVISKALKKELNSVEIDSDELKKMLPEFKEYGGLMANYVHEESSVMAKTVEDEVFGKGYNVVLPIVGKNQDVVSNLIDKLVKNGYKDIGLYFVNLDEESFISRAMTRLVDEGRLLPPSYLKSIFSNPNKNPSNTYELMKNKEGVTYYAKYNNSVPFGTPAILEEERGSKQIGLNNKTNEELGTSGETTKGKGNRPDDSTLRVARGNDGDVKGTQRFSNNLLNSLVLNENQKQEVREAVKNDFFSYAKVNNKTEYNKAVERFNSNGLDKSYENFMNNSSPTYKTVIDGEVLIKELAKNNDSRLEDVMGKLADDATENAQALQAYSILQRMTPEGQLKSLERSMNRMQKDLDDYLGNKAPTLRINETLRNNLLNARTAEDAEKARDAIANDLEKQKPKTIHSMLNSWRYLAMLGNPRTHIRNILGNALFTPMVGMKNIIGTGLEKVFVKDGAKTKAILTNSEVDKARIDEGRRVYDTIKATIEKGNKYEHQDFTEKTVVGKTLNKLSNKNTELLDKEDFWFSSRTFASSYAQFMKANNLTTENMTDEMEKKATAYATKEAKKATYRDADATAKWLNKLETNKNTKVAGFIKKAMLPFTQTPINIIKRGVEYSPIGLVDTITRKSIELKNGKINTTEYLDSLAGGLTGTGVAILGGLLASLGIFRTKDDDKDRKKYYDQDNGEQDYSIDLSFLGIDGTYTIDWATPTIMPFAIGAEIYDAFKNMEGIEGFGSAINAVADIASKVFDPIMETSMLSSVQDGLKSYSEGGEWLGDMLMSVGSSYIQQMFPTLFGQIARTIDDTRRTTYPNDGGLDQMIKKVLNKIPFASKLNEPYINKEGKEEKNEDLGMGAFGRAILNFISPGYYSSKDIDKYDEEMYRLYESTGDASAIPSDDTTNFTYDKEKYDLSDEQYTAWNKQRYETESKYVNEFIDSDVYNSLSDEDKVNTIASIRKYAQMVAKDEYLTGIGKKYDDETYNKVKGALDKGVSLYNYYLTGDYYNNLSKANGDEPKTDYIDYLNESGMSDDAKQYMYSLQYGDSKVYDYIEDMSYDSKTKLAIYEVLADTVSDKDSDGNTVSNSKAQKIKEQYQKLGVYDDIVKYIKTHDDVSYSSFGLSKTVVEGSSTGTKSTYDTAYSSVFGSNKASTSTKSSSSSVSSSSSKKASTGTQNSVYNKEEEFQNQYNNVMNSKAKSTDSSLTTCPKCGKRVTPINGKCPVCGNAL